MSNQNFVKYVSLSYEADGYRGRENILLILHEQYIWLKKYVKHADKNWAGAAKIGF